MDYIHVSELILQQLGILYVDIQIIKMVYQQDQLVYDPQWTS